MIKKLKKYEGRDSMAIPFDRKAVSTIFIINILLFSGMFGVGFNLFSNSTESDDQTVAPGLKNELEFTDEIEDPVVTHDQEQAKPEALSSRGTPRTDYDVGIVSISDIDKDELKIDHYPGTVAHMNVTVKNYGDTDITTPFEILLTISDGNTRPPGYHFQDNKTFPTCLGLSKIAANESRNISWNWTVPLKMPDGCEKNFSESSITFTAFFTTLMENDVGSNNNQEWINILVNQPDFEIRLEKGWPFWKVEEKDKIITVRSGEPNLFQLNFTMHNDGKGSYINYTTTEPTDWKAIPPPRKYYNDRSNTTNENLSLTIFPSVNREYLPTATWLYITLTAICESYPLAFAIITFRVKINFIPFPQIIPPEPPSGEDIYKIPPGEAYINFKVYNMGNGEDNFETKAQVGETSYEKKLLEKKGWKAIVHSGKYTRILKRGEYQVVTVKLFVPSMVRSGSPCAVKLTAISIKNPNHPDSSKNSTYYVFTDLFKNVAFVDKELKPMYMFPDSERSTIFKIRNVGNYVDNTIQVNVTILPEDWEVIIDSSDLPVGGIPINGTADIEVTVKTPNHVVESKYDIVIGLLSNYNLREEKTLEVNVLKVRKISLRCVQAKKMGNISEKISYLLTIENNGNSKDTINLRYSLMTPEMDQNKWRVELSKNHTTLYPYESRDVIVTILIPHDALADTNYLTLNVQEGYIIEISGISQNDTTVTDEKEIEIVVNPIYDFSFNKEKDRKYLILHQTQILDYSFSVENKGNMWDLIEIWPESTRSNLAWISIPYEERKLLAGVTEELTINFDPPPTLSAGEYVFIIHGRSANNPLLNSSLELTLEIIEADLELTEIRIGDKLLSEAEIKEGETVLLRVRLTNVGDLDYFNKTTNRDVVIKFMEGSNYIGETNISYLPSQRTSDENSIWVSHSWKIGKARLYNLIVKLDPYEAFSESVTDNNELSGKIDVKAVDAAGEGGDEIESSDIFTMLGLIIACVIIMLIGLWMNISFAKRAKKKGYTKDGEYKPYDESAKTDFDRDEEEEEPEGGVLGIRDKHPYAAKKGDKFMKDVLSIITMKPIRKTKPIKKSKPITSLAADSKMGLERPHIAGLLPPKKDTGEDEKSPENKP